MKLYHVAPRYSGGSPAQVDGATARQVLQQEMALGPQLEGNLLVDTDPAYGGIVIAVEEDRGKVYVEDMATGNTYRLSVAEWAQVRPWHELTAAQRMRYLVQYDGTTIAGGYR